MEDTKIDYGEQNAVGPALQSSIQSPEVAETRSISSGLKNKVLQALTALAVLGSPNIGHAEPNKPTEQVAINDHKNPLASAPKVASRNEHQDNDHDHGVTPVDHGTNDNEPHVSHLGHHTVKLGPIMALGHHPTWGTEFTYTYMPDNDDRKKLHLTLTPVDFFAAQHGLEVENEGKSEFHTKPKFYYGMMVGVTYFPKPFIGIEVEVGAGLAALPTFNIDKGVIGGIQYEFAPAIKSDIQVEVSPFHGFPKSPWSHLVTYIGYSPEFMPKPVPHAITEKGVERKPHMAHVLAAGIGAEF